jgi:ribonuclease HI
MAIYVDDIQHYSTGPWCHMATNGTIDELHEFAQNEVGLKSEWFQPHGSLPHYDLRPIQRQKAIKAGAIEVNSFQILIICTEKYPQMKEKTLRDLGLIVDQPEPTGIVNIYTDGGCWPNPGIGGWSAILMWENAEKRISGSCQDATSSRMELTAAIEALKVLEKPSHVIINTDSKYLMLGYTRWLQGWIDRGWKTSAGDPVKNQDLWLTLIAAAAPHEIEWYHVRGHNGNIFNEEADRLATEAREELTERMQVDDE